MMNDMDKEFSPYINPSFPPSSLQNKTLGIESWHKKRYDYKVHRRCMNDEKIPVPENKLAIPKGAEVMR